jgi:ribosomal protein L15
VRRAGASPWPSSFTRRPARATVRVHAASASAKSKIEAAGGNVEILE